jgi:hypothetical protein
MLTATRAGGSTNGGLLLAADCSAPITVKPAGSGVLITAESEPAESLLRPDGAGPADAAAGHLKLDAPPAAGAAAIFR